MTPRNSDWLDSHAVNDCTEINVGNQEELRTRLILKERDKERESPGVNAAKRLINKKNPPSVKKKENKYYISFFFFFSFLSSPQIINLISAKQAKAENSYEMYTTLSNACLIFFADFFYLFIYHYFFIIIPSCN